MLSIFLAWGSILGRVAISYGLQSSRIMHRVVHQKEYLSMR
jgi:hypothetical protein